MRKTIDAKTTAVGYYSPGTIGGGLIFVSGQAPLDPRTGKLVDGDFKTKARQCVRNIETILQAAGASLDDVVKTTVFLETWTDFAALNEVYAEIFPTTPPARSTIQGARPPGHLLAIEAIATAPES